MSDEKQAVAKLQRTREQWEKCDPEAMSRMSQAAIFYALQDAKRDVLALHDALTASPAHTESAAPVDSACSLAVAAQKMLNGYAESYEAMACDRKGTGTVDCISVAHDIRVNMAGWFGEYANAAPSPVSADEHCMCPACRDGVIHASDCAVHNGPALAIGPCDCATTPAPSPVSGADHERNCQCPACNWNRNNPETVNGADERAAAFQSRVQPWMLACFGAEIAGDRMERNHRFFEEATETVQANGMTRSEAHQLVDYTFDRPVGELNQEVGGVMVTLAALCLASGVDMHAAGETELARVWTKIEKIRAKQAAKPKHSPLPEHAALAPTPTDEERPVEIWHGERKVTIYSDMVLRVWGANIETEMSEVPRDSLQAVQDAMDWLYATPAGQQSLSDEQVQRFMYRMIEAGFLPQRPDYDTDMANARAILAIAAPATADAPQRHSWTLEGMKRDPQGVWVLASHVGTVDMRDAEKAPTLGNPLSPYGMLVRALRIVTGTTLREMANHVQSTPAWLSAIECGRRQPTEETATAAASFFSSRGIHDTDRALLAAMQRSGQ